VSLADYFPAQIRGLPAFEGQFDAFKLSAEACDVLFGIYPAGTPSLHPTAMTPITWVL